MLENLTGKEELKEELRKIKSQVEDLMLDQKKANESIRNELALASQAITNLEKNKDSMLLSLKKDIDDISKAKEEILKSAKILQETQSALYSQVYGKLNDALKEHVISLKSTTKEFESLKPEVKDAMQLLSSIKDEVNKLRELSKLVKTSDLQLSEHMNNVQKLDDEKLRLMRQIDKLQDIIAKERRGSVRRITY